ATNFVAQVPPFIDRPLQAEGFGALYGAVERHPSHHLRMGELARTAADFPDSLVGLAPNLLQMFEEGELRVPSGDVGRQSAAAGLMVDVHDLSKHVELALAVGGVADPHRRRAFITG